MRQLFRARAVVTAMGRAGRAIVVEHGRVVAVGDESDVADTGIEEVIETDGYLVPGFRDAHIHAIPYAALLSGCSLKNAASIDDAVARLRDHASTLAEHEPIVAARLDDESLAEGRLPTSRDLDRVAMDRPVVVYRYCGHIAVANTRALALSGIDASTENPDGGGIDRDTSGQPTGVLRETAMSLLGDALSRGGPVHPDAVVDALTRLAGLGITSIGAMIGYGDRPSDSVQSESALLRDIEHRLPLRVHGLSITSDMAALEQSAALLTGTTGRLDWLGVKRFSDGSLGGHTAALCSPFADMDTIGTLRLTDEDVAVARRTLSLGGMVAIHAIGDRAIGEVLTLFEDLIRSGANPSSLRMEHVSVASPEIIERFAASGVTAVVQPAFLASESSWLPRRLGPDRISWAYPFRSMADAGIPLAGSSDCIVEPPSPLWGIAAAMDRHGINPDQAISGLDALGMFTAGGAAAMREPEPLAPGSPADFVSIDVDLATASAAEVREATVIDTWIEGEQVSVDRSLPTWVD